MRMLRPPTGGVAADVRRSHEAVASRRASGDDVSLDGEGSGRGGHAWTGMRSLADAHAGERHGRVRARVVAESAGHADMQREERVEEVDGFDGHGQATECGAE